MNTDAPQRYDAATRVLHWLMLVLFTAMFGTAIAWNLSDSYRFLVPVHRGLGMLLMLIAIMRVLYAWISAPNRPPVQLAVRLGHVAIYVLMVVVPLLALIREAGAGQGNHVGEVPWMVWLGDHWHGELGWALLVLIGGHAGMAILHQLRGEKLLQRMM